MSPSSNPSSPSPDGLNTNIDGPIPSQERLESHPNSVVSHPSPLPSGPPSHVFSSFYEALCYGVEGHSSGDAPSTHNPLGGSTTRAHLPSSSFLGPQSPPCAAPSGDCTPLVTPYGSFAPMEDFNCLVSAC